MPDTANSRIRAVQSLTDILDAFRNEPDSMRVLVGGWVATLGKPAELTLGDLRSLAGIIATWLAAADGDADA